MDGHALVPGLEFTNGFEIAALKKAQDGEGAVLRLVEKRGSDRSVNIDLSAHGTTATTVDLLERDCDRKKPSKDHIARFTPYQIVTIRVT